MNAQSAAEHAPVFDFDFIADPHVLEDVHKGYMRLKKAAPPLFWTPHNGGHWVTMTTEGATKVLRHPEIFSSKFLSIPPNPQQPRMIPESLDPPEHRAFRQLLRPFFEGKAIAPLEARITEWTEELIDAVAASGQCEFVDALASRLPVSVFMEMFGFPLERFEEFRGLVTRYFSHEFTDDQRAATAFEILGVIAGLIHERTANPKNDLISTLITIDFEGRKLAFDELMSIAFLMFLAGLDTVTNAMTFGMRHLAHDAALRQRIIDDPACIPNAVEELMRRYTFVTTPRYIVQDHVMDGVQLRAGESILVPLMVVGWDEKLNPDPETVSVDRPAYRHAGFGSGVHTCLGLHLARMELVIFYRTWFKRIGHFHEVDTGTPLQMRAGSVLRIEALTLGWTPAGAA